LFTATKARGFALPVHFKKVRKRWSDVAVLTPAVFQTLETANALRGMKLRRAQKFLENVKLQKEAVPFRNRNGGAGRHAQVCRFERWRVLEALDLTAALSGQGLAHGAGWLAQEGGRIFAGTVAERAVQR
jgi:hypothetical protein